jgi:hypothetical protein
MANVYGNSGNRWWVGLNVGSDQSTVFGTSSLLSPVGYESLPSGNAVDDAKFAAAAAVDKAGVPVTISVENVSWFNINGPYTTQAAANAAIPAIQKAHPAPGAVAQAIDAVTGKPQSNSSPLSWIADITGFSGSNFVIRATKVIVGGMLLIIGLAHITGASNAVASAARNVPLPV